MFFILHNLLSSSSVFISPPFFFILFYISLFCYLFLFLPFPIFLFSFPTFFLRLSLPLSVLSFFWRLVSYSPLFFSSLFYSFSPYHLSSTLLLHSPFLFFSLIRLWGYRTPNISFIIIPLTPYEGSDDLRLQRPLHATKLKWLTILIHGCCFGYWYLLCDVTRDFFLSNLTRVIEIASRWDYPHIKMLTQWNIVNPLSFLHICVQNQNDSDSPTRMDTNSCC